MNATDATGLNCDLVLDILTLVGGAALVATFLGLGPAGWVALIGAAAGLSAGLLTIGKLAMPENNC